MEIEKTLKSNEMIVSSTDKTGVIVYANKEFSLMSEYSKDELYGKPHNIVRHPDMPRAIFKYMWDQLLSKKAVTAYVKNHSKDKKSFYWVKAMIFPIVKDGKIEQITSYRTKPTKFAVEQVEKIYSEINDHDNGKSIESSFNFFVNYLKERNLTYNQFINRLNEEKQVTIKELLNIDVSTLKFDHLLFKSKIESDVEKGIENIFVIDSTHCDLGQKLKAFENNSFALDERFSTIKQLHNNIHNKMQQYVEANSNQKIGILDDVTKDKNKLFELLEDLKDHYKV